MAVLVGMGVLAIEGVMEQAGHADVALVLGNKVELDGKPSARLQARLDKAVELYHAGYFPTVIVNGGIGNEGYDEAIVMRDYLITKGVSAENIITDSKGINTFESAKQTVQILHQLNKNSVCIVSQYFHLPRSRLALEHFGVKTIYAVSANYFEINDIYSLFREFAGYIYYRFRGYN